MTMSSHPLRLRAIAEMHLRPMSPINAPCRMLQVVRLTDRNSLDDEIVHASTFAKKLDGNGRHIAGNTNSGIAFAWERHSEASTAMIILPDAAEPADASRMIAWLEGFPGLVMRATQIDVAKDEDAARNLIEKAEFALDELVAGILGTARFWSDFKLHEDSHYGRIVLSAGDMQPNDLGRLVQQLQELGNYRNLALMGFALARDEAPAIQAIEERLVAVTDAMRAGDDDRGNLDALTSLAAETSALRARTGYRLAATAAYGEIVDDRLKTLSPRPIRGAQTLADFTERRLLPARRTCAAFKRRIDAAAEGIEQATSMLRTRVDLSLEAQNIALLRSMERSAARQLKLQHLVEGLSVVALAYYAVALLDKIVSGAEAARWLNWDAHIVTAAMVLPALLGFAILLRWRTHRVDRED
ncbi:MAG: DUF3422 domain-containing protein [Sphingomonadaceae bacterium]